MAESLIRIYEDPADRAECRACGADIEWHETLSGKRMPMNAGSVPRRSERDDGGRVVAFYAMADSHWATCTARDEFKGKRWPR